MFVWLVGRKIVRKQAVSVDIRKTTKNEPKRGLRVVDGSGAWLSGYVYIYIGGWVRVGERVRECEIAQGKQQGKGLDNEQEEREACACRWVFSSDPSWMLVCRPARNTKGRTGSKAATHPNKTPAKNASPASHVPKQNALLPHARTKFTHHILRRLAAEVSGPVKHLHHQLQLPSALEVVEQHEGVVRPLPQLGENILALLGAYPGLLQPHLPPPSAAAGTPAVHNLHNIAVAATVTAAATAATTASNVGSGVGVGATAAATEHRPLVGEGSLESGPFLTDVVFQDAVVQRPLDLFHVVVVVVVVVVAVVA